MIEQATSANDWNRASKLLLSVVDGLDKMGKSLWSKEQVSVESLRESYDFSELYMLYDDGLVGVVFLQKMDRFFWPEVKDNNSLFIHKLAISPGRSGEKLGRKAIDEIVEIARISGIEWVRLDCDDRPQLHRFYQACGFSLVDTKQMDDFRVCRYQLLTNA